MNKRSANCEYARYCPRRTERMPINKVLKEFYFVFMILGESHCYL